MQGDAAIVTQLPELVEENQVLRSGCSENHDGVRRVRRGDLQQRPDRCEIGPGSDQHQAVPGPGGVGEGAVGTGEDDPRAGPGGSQFRRVLIGDPDGDAQPIPRRCRGQEEPVGPGPQLRGEQAPGEVLTAPGLQLVEVPAAELQVKEVGGQVHGVHQLQPMPPGTEERTQDPVPEQAGADGDQQDAPVDALRPAGQENRVEAEHVGDRQEHGDVGEDVEEVPHLAAQSAAHRKHRCDRRQQQ